MVQLRSGCAIVLLLSAACGEARPAADVSHKATDAEPALNGETHVAAASAADNGIGTAHENGSADAPTDAIAVADPVYAEGLRVYREQYCGTCHAFAPAGSAGIFGPTHDGMRKIAEQRIRDPNYRGRATTIEEYVRESVIEPGAYRVPGYERTRFLMPAYTNLTETELNAVVRLLIEPIPVAGGR